MIEFAALVVVVLLVRAYQHRDIAAGPAPELDGPLLDGRAFRLMPMDKPVLVHFWATWCSICRAEQGTINDLARDYSVITVAMQSGSDDAVTRHLSEQNLAFAVINDADGRIANRWGVRAVPATFVVDRAGMIRFVEVGYTTELGLRARMNLAR